MLYNEKWEKPAVKLEPWQQHLLDAAAYIREHGWCQGREYDSMGRVCILGALVMTKAGNGAAFRLKAHLGINGLVTWNDGFGRTKEEVIAALEAAAKGE